MGKSIVAQPELPAELATDSFRRAWDSFTQHRRELRKPLTPTGAVTLLRRLIAYGPKRAADMLDRASANGWQGVIFDDTPKPTGKSSDQLDREQRADKQRASAILRERQAREEEKKKRIARVKTVAPEKLDAARKYFASKQPNAVSRAAMLKADPLGGGRLTDLIYGELVSREGVGK